MRLKAIPITYRNYMQRFNMASTTHVRVYMYMCSDHNMPASKNVTVQSSSKKCLLKAITETGRILS